MNLLDVMAKRRSIRKYTADPVSEEDIDLILKAGMLAPSGKGRMPWSFIVIRDKETLKALRDCRQGGAALLDTADCAIAVLGDTVHADTYIEDCSVALGQMHLMASFIGLGSCWLQIRLRESNTGTDSESFVRGILGFPEDQMLEGMLTIGHPDQNPAPHDPDALPMEKVHYEKW